MRELEDAINESLSESNSFAAVVKRMKHAGYDLSIVLEAIVEVSTKKKVDVETEAAEPPSPPRGRKKLRFTAQDRKFLQSLRITDGE